MKNYAKLYQIVILSASLVLSAVYFHTMVRTITAIRYITFSFDPQLSPMICEAIKKKVMLFESDGIYNPSAIVEALLIAFPVIKSLDIEQFPPHVARITITALNPIIHINDNRVLVENQSILSAHYYAPYTTKSLQRITFAGYVPSQVSAAIMDAMKQCLARKVFDYYTVYFVNEQEWYFNDISDSVFTLCCNTSSLPINETRVAYAKLKKQIKREPVATKWIADMRFDDQIILSRDKGGRYG